MPTTLQQRLLDWPEAIIALMFSAPCTTDPGSPSVTIEFGEEETTAKVRRGKPDRRPLRLLPTKDTIFAGILLHLLVSRRGPEFADSVLDRVRRFAEESAATHSEFSPRLESHWYPPSHPPEADTAAFFQNLDVSASDIDSARSSTLEALNFLESEGLAIDPAFTPEVMVLAGLLPMHFSVRTPKGERVHREIQINAPMWSLDIVKGTKNDRPYTDFEFRFRGLEIVRKAVTSMATHYLEAEERNRRRNGQPLLRRKGSPELDV